ncbi:LysR family transcriptional regulator [Photobacterium profundum]|uniref:Transcriptional regulator n=1 Tax=Photobacterium profundum 3TCK TaxID=314280 RepID=Q1ZAG0_9GAMM|nr:LysR substrate-binding domain-containing protein [Photobacterium profundum]EAS45532.1 transcriptional regulator [Photobacterium profundum 3TCK]PSV63292.1 LysR family transcriptional regulator [Photobacterium profundum]
MRNLDLDALRCFVLGIELGSFALAAERLNRSPSAASAQLKKLEQQCNTPLVAKIGRHLEPTEAGEIVLAYARRMLQLNDEALHRLMGNTLEGKVAFGLQEDFSEVLLPQLLGAFSRTHPQLQLQSVVGRHKELINGIKSGELDFSLGWEGKKAAPYSECLAELPLHWYGPKSKHLKESVQSAKPLPLVMLDSACMIRQQATEALDHEGIPWKITFVGRSLSNLWRGVEAGLGITVRSSFSHPDSVSKLNGLPKLGKLRLCLDRNQYQLEEVQAQLYGELKQQLLQYLEK